MDIYTYYSFYITCAFLVTTGTITFIEALRTPIVPMRHILNLETCIRGSKRENTKSWKSCSAKSTTRGTWIG